MIGMPPSHLKKVPFGPSNKVCLPIQRTGTSYTNAIASMKGMSQFEVWGATMKMNFRAAGQSPTTFHPIQRNNTVDNR